jgi:hypothetical protein
MNPTDQLRDIQGLDAISWWPLAPGWWILIGFIFLLLVMVGLRLYRRRAKQKHDWRKMAHTEWLSLRPLQAPARDQITFLSILLRRVAIQRYGRKACAGLSGEKWLTWLTQHDPQQFDWLKSGRILIEVPYMPKDASIDDYQVDLVYRAVRAWIDE